MALPGKTTNASRFQQTLHFEHLLLTAAFGANPHVREPESNTGHHSPATLVAETPTHRQEQLSSRWYDNKSDHLTIRWYDNGEDRWRTNR